MTADTKTLTTARYTQEGKMQVTSSSDFSRLWLFHPADRCYSVGVLCSGEAQLQCVWVRAIWGRERDRRKINLMFWLKSGKISGLSDPCHVSETHWDVSK